MAVITSIKQTARVFKDPQEGKVYRQTVESIQQDLANLRAAIVGITAKLDADAGVTDTNYASLWNPAALYTRP